MHFNFDEVIDRRHTNSIKYDFAVQRGMPRDVLPMWVADMDFQTVPAIMDALVAASKHGIFGYSESMPSYTKAVQQWWRTRFDWEPPGEWLVKTSGVVSAIATAIRTFTRKGEAVLVQRPVYYPFSSIVESNGRLLVNSPLVRVCGKKGGETYQIDFDDFEAKICRNRVRLFLLCNPHNPVGRVWTSDELTRLGEICLKHGVRVLSDEIHADFVHEGYKHTVFAGLCPEFSNITITCTAPSKTFNLAGLQVSNIFIKDHEARSAFRMEMQRSGHMALNCMALVACEAAYTHGAAWLDALRHYLAQNIAWVHHFLDTRLPEIRLVEPQATYLLWLDCRRLDLDEEERRELIVHKARLWFDEGRMFGSEGQGFERVNIACPRRIVQEAFERLEKAVHESLRN